MDAVTVLSVTIY